MAIKRSKPRKNRNTTSNQPNSKAAYVVLGGILLVGIAGWYHSTFEKDIGRNTPVLTANKTIAIPQKKPESTSNKTTLPAIPLPNAVIPPALSTSEESFSKQIVQRPVQSCLIRLINTYHQKPNLAQIMQRESSTRKRQSLFMKKMIRAPKELLWSNQDKKCAHMNILALGTVLWCQLRTLLAGQKMKILF